MLKRMMVLPIAILTLVWGGEPRRTVSAEVALPLIKAAEADEAICLMPPPADRADYQRSSAGRGAAGEGSPPGWPGKDVMGGNVPPTAMVADPWPTFDGMAVDSENGIVAMSDENRHGVLIYDRTAGS